ncbi:MAG: chromosomal replication initiator protein DnaA, partial [Rhodospirillales bacterium]|nr:chromosomal replication initiator protein DnaA [Rhodospirillales bacterium]
MLQTPSAWNDEARLVEQWGRVRARLQAEVGEVEYRTWLKQVSFAGVAGDEAVVMLPTRFLRDWVNKEYGELIASFWQQENATVRRVEFRTGAPAARPAAPDLAEPQQAAAPALVPQQRPEAIAALDQRFTFETFVVGKPNEFAYACARRVAEAPATAGFNPLFLYGGVGLGKTHLMHAIAWELSTKRPNGRPVSVAYMSAERFMYRFINALRSQSTLEFKNELRSVDVLMIDDLQFLIGKDNTQEEFFHTFNALVDAGKQIVISADKSPSDLSGLEDRLRTRLGCGMVADLHATTFELRYSILEAKALRAGVEVPPKVVEFLARKITSNNRELEGALNRLVAHANLFNRQITLDTAHEVLHDVLKAHDRKISIQEIQKRVCEHYSIRIAEMSSARRARNIARPRQVAMYLAKQLTSKSLP